MASSAVKRVNEIPIAIGALDAKVRQQAHLIGRYYQAGGWALLTLAVLDCLGNIVGIPILTGNIGAAMPGTGGTIMALILQLALFGGAIKLLYQSKVMLWVMDDTYDFQSAPDDSVKDRFRKNAGRITDKAKDVRASVNERLSGVNKGLRYAILAGLGALCLVALFTARHLLIVAAALFVAYAIEGGALLRLVHAIGPRIRDEEDSISKMGIVAGGVAALLLFLLIGLQMGALIHYLHHAYVLGDVVILQVVDVVLLSFLVFLVQVAAKRSLEGADYYLINSGGNNIARPVVQSFDFSSQQTVPIFGRFEENSLPAVVVVGQNADGGYDITNPRKFMALHHRKLHVLDMRQFSLQLPRNVAYKDPFGYFTGTFSFSAIARSTAAMSAEQLAQMQKGAPEQLVQVMMTDLFMNPSLNVLLSRTAVKAIDRYLGKRDQVRNLLEFMRGMDVETLHQQSRMKDPGDIKRVSSVLDILPLSNQLLAHTTIAGEYDRYRTAIAERWFPWREKLGPASAQIPLEFKAELKQYFVDGFQGQDNGQDTESIAAWIEVMLTCCDITMEVNAFHFEASDAAVIDNRLLTIHEEVKVERARYTERANVALGQMLEMLKLEKTMDHEVRLGITNNLPGLLPFLLSSPLGNEVITSLMRHGVSVPDTKTGETPPPAAGEGQVIDSNQGTGDLIPKDFPDGGPPESGSQMVM